MARRLEGGVECASGAPAVLSLEDAATRDKMGPGQG